MTILMLALALLLSACSRQSDSPTAEPTWRQQYDLGMRFLSQGNYQEAVIAFRAAIEINPRRADAYLGLADAYLGLGDATSAIAALREGHETTGDDRLSARMEELEVSGPGGGGTGSGQPDTSVDPRILSVDRRGRIVLDGAVMPFSPFYFNAIGIPLGMTLYDFIDVHVADSYHAANMIEEHERNVAMFGPITGAGSGGLGLSRDGGRHVSYPVFQYDGRLMGIHIGLNDPQHFEDWRPAFLPGGVELGMGLIEAISPFVVPGMDLYAFLQDPTYENALSLAVETVPEDPTILVDFRTFLDVNGEEIRYQVELMFNEDSSPETFSVNLGSSVAGLYLHFANSEVSQISIQYHNVTFEGRPNHERYYEIWASAVPVQ
jgi:hypothetical protein